MKRQTALLTLLLAASLTLSAQPNVILNSSFNSGTDPWLFWQNTGMRPIERVSPGFDATPAAKVTITQQGNNMQLFQRGLTLEPNTSYTLTFAARSSRGQDLAVFIQKDVADWRNYGLESRTVNLSTAWQMFTINFVTRNFSGVVHDGRIRFWFVDYATGRDEYYIDDVVLVEGVLPPCPFPLTSPPPNIEVNAGLPAFLAVTASGDGYPLTYQWQQRTPDESTFTDYPGATFPSLVTGRVAMADNGTEYRCVVQRTGTYPCTVVSSVVQLRVFEGCPGTLLRNVSFDWGTESWFHWRQDDISFTPEGNIARLHINRITTDASNTPNLQLMQAGFSLIAGETIFETYQVSFDASSSRGQDMQLSVLKNSSPFTMLGLDRVIDVTTTMQHYGPYTFKAPGPTGTVHSDTRLRFMFTGFCAPGDTYIIDNVCLTPAFVIPKAGAVREPAPNAYELMQNYPNPFNPTTTIGFAITQTAHVSLKVFNVLGQEVATIVNETLDAGRYEKLFDANDLTSGVYFYRLQTGTFAETKKLLLTK